jgi:AAHS family benzoate transporter-like MFS transporter
MNKVNVSDTVDNSRFNRFHLLVVALCAFTIVFDGYDLTIYGAAVPGIIEELEISSTQAGAIGSSALVGMMIGAIVFGTLADRIGRKTVIIGCVAAYSVFTMTVFFAGTPVEMGIYRFLAGLGLGGVMPNAIALVTEYAPKHLRSTLVSVMFSGYMVGGVIAALISIWLIPAFGWRSIFLVGGLQLLLIPILIKYMPDSLAFYLKRGKSDEAVSALQRVEPELRLDSDPRLEVPEEPGQGSSVARLFKDGYAFSTIMLWIAFFMVLLMIYGLVTWLPQLMIESGLPLTSSLSFQLTMFLAAIVITWCGGFLADRVGPKRILIVSYVIAGAFVALLGFGEYAVILYVAVALGGGATFAGQIFANAYAGQYYPTSARSTGVGWCLGVGRIGAIIGPLVGGILLSTNAPLYVNFLAFAAPGLIAAVAVFLVKERSSAVDQEIAVSEAAKQGRA